MKGLSKGNQKFVKNKIQTHSDEDQLISEEEDEPVKVNVKKANQQNIKNNKQEQDKMVDFIPQCVTKHLQKHKEGQQNKGKLIMTLKQLHMNQQQQLVKGIKQMAIQSKKMIDDISIIEVDIDKYQLHIDEWIHKVSEIQTFVDKIRSVQGSFKAKANNLTKLKDYLNVQKPKRR